MTEPNLISTYDVCFQCVFTSSQCLSYHNNEGFQMLLNSSCNCNITKQKELKNCVQLNNFDESEKYLHLNNLDVLSTLRNFCMSCFTILTTNFISTELNKIIPDKLYFEKEQ